MAIETLDLSALVTLHVLLEERHVTRAARRLGITQSSTSHRLAKLRDELGDPLFVRRGGRLEPTAHARALAEPLADALARLERVVRPAQRFDPATSRASIRLVLPDLLIALVPALVGALRREAPGLDVRLQNLDAQLGAQLDDPAPTVALAPAHFASSDLVARKLGTLRFGVAMRRHHPLAKQELTLASWLAHEHVVVELGNASPNLVEDELRKRGLMRRVGLRVPSFLCGLHVVADSDLVMNVPVPLVDDALTRLRLVRRDAPLRLPAIAFASAWHPRHRHDDVHRWARERIHGFVRDRLRTT